MSEANEQNEKKAVGVGMLIIDEHGKATFSGDAPPAEIANMLKEQFGIEIQGEITGHKKITPDVENFYILTDKEFDELVNRSFTNKQNIPFNFRESYEGEHDTHTVFCNIDGKKPVGMSLQRLQELGNGDWELNGLHPSLYLNELVRYGELPAGDYIIKAE